MNFESIKEFILKKLKMSHVFQPLVIRELVDSGGHATVRQLALALLVQDESQLSYYEKRVREMPL